MWWCWLGHKLKWHNRNLVLQGFCPPENLDKMFLVMLSTVELALVGKSCTKLHWWLSPSETMIVSNLIYSVTLNKGYVTLSFRFSLLNHLIEITMDFLYLFPWLFSCISTTWRNFSLLPSNHHTNIKCNPGWILVSHGLLGIVVNNFDVSYVDD